MLPPKRLAPWLVVSLLALAACTRTIELPDGTPPDAEAPDAADDRGTAPDAPAACVAPDGSRVREGSTWSDGCVVCACLRGGGLACQSPCDAGADAGADAARDADADARATCRAPDGREIPAGATFSDGCNDCVCLVDGSLACTRRACVDAGPEAAHDAGLDTGFDASSDAARDAGSDSSRDAGVDAAPDVVLDASRDAGVDGGSDGGPAPDAAAACNALPLYPPNPRASRTRSDRPLPAGGVIVDGVYRLDAVVEYLSDHPPADWRPWTLEIRGRVMNFAIEHPWGAGMSRWNGSYSVSGPNLTIVTSCGPPRTVEYGFSAIGDQLRLFDRPDGWNATFDFVRIAP